MIPTLLLPFNVVKGVFNASLVLILYKPVRRAMQAAHIMPSTPHPAHVEADAAAMAAAKRKRIRVSVMVSAAGLILLAVAIAVFYYVLHGQFELFK